MLNKLILIFLLIVEFSQNVGHYANKGIHEANINKLKENHKKIISSAKNYNKTVKLKVENLKKLMSFKDKMSKLNTTSSADIKEYNKIKKRYEEVRKKYNEHRSNECAKLPAVDMLTNLNPRLHGKNFNCARWSYWAQQLGVQYGKALYYLGKLKSFSLLRKPFGCLRYLVVHKSIRNITVMHYRKCFSIHFQRKVKQTVASLNKGITNVEIKNKYVSLTKNKDAVNDLLTHIKNLIK